MNDTTVPTGTWTDDVPTATARPRRTLAGAQIAAALAVDIAERGRADFDDLAALGAHLDARPARIVSVHQ